MPVYTIRFTINGHKARWITGRVESKNDAIRWFKEMLASNYTIDESKIERIFSNASFSDTTYEFSDEPKPLFIPKHKMFDFSTPKPFD